LDKATVVVNVSSFFIYSLKLILKLEN